MKRNSPSVNLFFFLPFLLWIVAGICLLCCIPADELFFWVNSRHSPEADILFPVCTRMGEFGGIIVTGLLLLLLVKPYRSYSFFFSAILGTVLPSLLSQLIKHRVDAPRPMQVFAEHAGVHRLESWPLLYQHSFPSGHTTGAFAFMAIVSFFLPPQYRGWGLLCFILALATAYSRMYLAAHFFADVYAGSLIGTLLAWIICLLLPARIDHWRQRLKK